MIKIYEAFSQNFDYTIEDVVTNLDGVDEVYVEISKDITEQLFKSAREIPVNVNGKHDESYVSGELQFIFEKGTGNLIEILLFPVYRSSSSGDFINGDFIDSPDSIYNNDNLISDVKSHLDLI